MVTITDWNDLDAVRNDLTASYTLQNDLDSSTAGYSGIGDDWKPLGFVDGDRNGNPFSGTLNGQGYQIGDLVIEENNSSQGGVAFITRLDSGGLVENLELDGTVDSTIANDFYGGLVAQQDGTIQSCVSHVDVTASSGNFVGGLVGDNNVATIADSYSTGSVDGDANVGGLLGFSNSGTIQTSYAVGSVTGTTDVGALVGNNEFGSELSDSYADEGTTGHTSLTGTTGGPNTNSYTLTTSEMQGNEASNTGNMGGFDFSNTWDTVLTEDSDTSADGYPILQGLDRQNQLEAQGIALVTVSESGAASAIATPAAIETTAFVESGQATATATGSGTETTSATEVSSVGATASPLSIETGRATEAGATAATATPVSTETTAFVESGRATATATPVAIETSGFFESGQVTATATSAGIETTRATETGSLTTLATPDVTATGRIGESGTATALATPNVIENVGVAEVGRASAIATPDVIETGRTFTPESGTVTATSTLSSTETTSATETGSVLTQATPVVIETATSSIVRVAPRRTLDQQLRAIGRVLDLNEP